MKRRVLVLEAELEQKNERVLIAAKKAIDFQTQTVKAGMMQAGNTAKQSVKDIAMPTVTV